MGFDKWRLSGANTWTVNRFVPITYWLNTRGALAVLRSRGAPPDPSPYPALFVFIVAIGISKTSNVFFCLPHTITKFLDARQMLCDAEMNTERLTIIIVNSRNTLHQRMAQAVSSQRIASPRIEPTQAPTRTDETDVVTALFAFGVR